jgi:hypothetical protein
MMRANNEKPRLSFYVIWIILTSICIPVALFISLGTLRITINIAGEYIYVAGVRHITEDYLALRVFVPVVGLLTGLLQYELLRRHLPRMGWWVIATLGGWLLGVLLIDIPIWMNWAHGPLNLDLAFILMGLAIGTGQWLLVRRRLPRAGWWIGANVVGWGMVGLITEGNSLGQFELFALGFMPACATAAALAYLMNQVKPAQRVAAPV